MKIGIATFGCDLKSGMSRYASSLISQFAKLAKDDEFEILAHQNAINEYMSGVKSGLVTSLDVSERYSNALLNVAWHQLSLPGICRSRDYDVLFLPAASRRTPFWVPCPTIGTVHDLSAFHVLGKYDQARSYYQTSVLPRLFKRLTHIIAISESTKRDIQEFVGISDDRISVIHHAADTNIFYPRDREASLNAVRSYGVRAPYIVYTSRIESPGKNHVRLIRAFEQLKRQEEIPHQLVLAGSDWHGAEEVHGAAENSPFSKDICLTGFVKGQDLPSLYCGADMLVFPSLFEGFGLPILEAMACGVPVACSDISSMPEIAGDAAVLFDPLEVESIADGMFSIVGCPEKRKSLAKEGLRRASEFSWEKTARMTLEVLHTKA